MKKLPISVLFLIILFAFASCNNQTDNQDALDTEDIDEDAIVEDSEPTSPGNQVVELYAAEFEQFPNASLSLSQPTGTSLKAGNTKFNFNVQNYELGAQTTLPDTLMLANSDNGQHIHFIVDNDPYDAHYESSFEKEMSVGDHVVLAFLSRSFHASVKNANSFVVKKFTVGSGGGNMDVDLSAPHMFYSRPKGTYTGEATEKILLDFFLVNTTLSADGMTVRVTVNDDRQFMIDKWQPYILENLPLGENTIKLELLDGDKNLVNSPFNPVTRTITLEPAEEDTM